MPSVCGHARSGHFVHVGSHPGWRGVSVSLPERRASKVHAHGSRGRCFPAGYDRVLFTLRVCKSTAPLQTAGRASASSIPAAEPELSVSTQTSPWEADGPAALGPADILC